MAISTFWNLKSGQSLVKEGLDKIAYVCLSFLRDVLASILHLGKQIPNGVNTVKMLPDQGPDRVHSIGAPGVRVKEYGPVIKFLPEYDQGVCHRL
jgi:hypothetical protein